MSQIQGFTMDLRKKNLLTFLKTYFIVIEFSI